MHSTTAWSLPAEKILTPDEVRQILQAAKRRSARDYTFLVVAANTGLRVSEVAHLMTDDVVGEQLIVVRRKKRVLGPSRIDVAPDAMKILREWLADKPQGYVFPGRCAPCWIDRKSGEREQVCIGGHAALRHVQRAWELYLVECGLRVYGRGIHSLRHYAITQFYAKYRDLRAAQLFAAHASSAMTERYAAVLDMREKVNAMEATV